MVSHTNYIRRGLGLVFGSSPLLRHMASQFNGLTGGTQLQSHKNI